MNRLWEIEWLKQRHYKPFWVICSMYVFWVMIITCTGMLFLQFLKRQGADFNGIDPTIIPIYDFPDIWQNMAYVASFCKVILGFLIVISVANEENYRTLRQNIIDGLSKKEWWISKLILIVVLSFLGTLLLFLLGLFMGTIYSHPDGLRDMWQCFDFLGAYFLVLLTYLTFCFWITLLIPRSGLVIVGLFLYTIMFEPFLALFLENFPHVYDFIRNAVPYFPIRSLYYLIPVPFPKYFLQEIKDFVPLKETFIVVGWLCLNLALSYSILRRKDW
jgi:hypothetical protein